MTHIYKSHYGWRAQTDIPLGDGCDLQFVTLKRSSGRLVTTAQRCRVSEDGQSSSFAPFSDFSEAVISEAPARVTEKIVADQHRRALQQLDAIKARCAAHYAKASALVA